MDHFTLFGLPIRIPVDGSLLTSSYQTLQRQYHPDRFATASESEHLQAVQKAAIINDAYQILKNPLRSAEYLLSLHHIDVLSEQQSLHDTDFLMQQLALREQLDDISQLRDTAQAESELALFIDKYTQTMQQHSQQLIEQLNQQQWSAAGDTARKLRFLDKLKQQAEQLEERLLDL